MTLRKSIDILFGLLGALLLALSGGMLVTLLRAERDLATEIRAQSQRDALLHLGYALRAEERAALDTILALDPPPASGPNLPPPAATDAALSLAARISAQDPHSQIVPLLDALATGLSRSRDHFAQITRGPLPANAATLGDWHRSLAAQRRSFDALSLHLDSHRTTPETLSTDMPPHALDSLREIGAELHGSLLDNRVRIETLLAGAPATPATLDNLRATTAAALGTRTEARRHAELAPRTATDPAVQALDLLAESYAPAESRLLDALANRRAGKRPADTATLNLWRSASRGSMQEFEHAEAELTTVGHALLDARIAQSRLALGAGTALTLASFALAAFALVFLRRRLLSPLDRIASRLAALSPDTTGTQGRDSAARALAALDRIEADTDRRAHRKAEFARLTDHAVTANRQMLADLEAAARVQIAQLPASPRAIPGAIFHALRHPSRIVAGDTFDCITRADGRSVTFQIDVAGHGAPAAIVSVAAHVALKQALLSAPPDEPLAATIASVNATWTDDLPYFTLLAVETDPATATARVVQCGHPALLRLPAEGGCEAVGTGGLPIGVLPDAAFDTLTCPFRSGDRLILTTDGIVEAADPQGRHFGESRLRDLLTTRPQPDVPALFARIERALWDWRGTDSPDDDVTILTLEAR